MSGFVESHSATSSACFPFALFACSTATQRFEALTGDLLRLNVTDHYWTTRMSRYWSIGWDMGCCGQTACVRSLVNTLWARIRNCHPVCLQAVQSHSKCLCCRHSRRRSCSNMSHRRNIPMTWMQYCYTLLCLFWRRFCGTTCCMHRSSWPVNTHRPMREDLCSCKVWIHFNIAS